MAIPKGLEPTGVILADKPAGPSSFAVVARVRARTGAKTGHAGTLDPFATGLLVLLSGRATSLQDRFMKLDKRYQTEIDLRGRTTTGDPEGEAIDGHEAPRSDELERSLDGLRGDVELPIPAASAVKIKGERAYRLHRQGVAVEMPTRRMRVARARARLVRGRHCAARRARRLRYLRQVDRRRARRALRHASPHRGRPVSRGGGRRERASCRSKTHCRGWRHPDEDRARALAARAQATCGRDRDVRRRPPRASIGARERDRRRASTRR